jgi:hypothetical protein
MKKYPKIASPKLISRLIEISGFLATALLLIILAPAALALLHRDYPIYAGISALISTTVLVLVTVILLLRLLNTDTLERRVERIETDVTFIDAMLNATHVHDLGEMIKELGKYLRQRFGMKSHD